MIRLDTHVHVWDPRVLDYPWLQAIPELDRAFLPEDYRSGAGRAVFVQADCAASQSLDEARWVVGLRSEWPELAGIVAAADLRSADLADHLNALAELDIVAGIRHNLQNEPVERFYDPALQHGLTLLGERGLTFDACIHHGQLTALVDLLERVPDLRVVLDHLGKPPVDEGIESDAGALWSAQLRRLAALKNTHVKLSGLPAETADPPAYDANTGRFLAFALEVFGAERCMLGSDWPVSAHLGAAEEPDAWTDRVRMSTGLEGKEWASVASLTGARFYRLAR